VEGFSSKNSAIEEGRKVRTVSLEALMVVTWPVKEVK